MVDSMAGEAWISGVTLVRDDDITNGRLPKAGVALVVEAGNMVAMLGELANQRMLLPLSPAMMEPMEISESVEQLCVALENYARRVREFTPIALSSSEQSALAVLRELGDVARLSDAGYRQQLAGDVVATVVLIVEAIHDPIRRRVAEAALATRPEFYSKNVGQRMAVLAKDWVSPDMYKDRRSGVLHDVAMALAMEFGGGARSLPRLCIAGDYDDRGLDADADALGRGLAELPIRLVSGYAAAGQRVGRAMLDALSDRGMVVDSDRVTQYARTVKDRSIEKDYPGHLVAYGRTQEDKRHRMLRDCKVVVLFAGGAGTRDEARIAENYRIPVIPLAFTGGAAQRYWQERRPAAETIILGGHLVDPVLYEQLGHRHGDAAVRAALGLVRQVIMAVPVDSCAIARG
ncbi:hypothetical protein ABZ942_42180 [Nocardia sp. NPDC046473]|uniref:hypothetical protein n=1 Tax=Nocardia sp. NPDC046473 TaxID=3155733 RepID=UPI003405AA31